MAVLNGADLPIGRHEHGGNIHRHRNQERDQPMLDFSANLNPLGPPAWLRSAINCHLQLLGHYPDPDCTELVRAVAERYRVDRELIVPGNGSTELLHLIPRIVSVRRALLPVPCYIDYIDVLEKNSIEVEFIDTAADGYRVSPGQIAAKIQGNDLVVFGNPVNPSGAFLEDEAILDLAQKHPDTLFVIDEAFHDFIEPFTTVGGTLANIITLNSLTKFFSIPGLRVGFGIFPEPYCRKIRELLPQWSVNTLAQIIAARAVNDQAYAADTKSLCTMLREQLRGALGGFEGIEVLDSHANYLLLRLSGGLSGQWLYQELLQEGIIIRRCGNYRGLGDAYVRVAVRTETENRRLVEALRKVIGGPANRSQRQKKRAAAIMFQGTSSNAGKSILSAALCRILYQDGYKVCPFKAQNMSLNSHVTVDGGEMGRAQVVQAQAAKLEPDWRMNPILLKPNSDTGSQVIVNGRPVRNMDVRQYHAFKDEAWKAVVASFDELRDAYEVIVMEGAGSPGEVNLKSHDIVNMKMARYAGAPVLLVGDIDRGGVYAAFAGIMDVLEEWERELIAGFIVNKFRGDESLLADAHRFIREHTGRDVLGVVPYISDMSIPQEDSVSLREGFYRDRGTGADQVEIVVVDIPHIANFTDIDPLYFEPDVNIRFVSDPNLFGRPDCVIIPGSKNVAGDLRFLSDRGCDRAIIDYYRAGGTIVGICGGYQMLGKLIADPYRIETSDGSIRGLGLLAVDTVMARDKTLIKRRGTHIESGRQIVGYEIHHGKTVGSLTPVLEFEGGETCGCRNDDGSVWGAYLHGIFDEDTFRRWFVDGLRRTKGLAPLGESGTTYNVDRSLDELADLVRSRVDIGRIYRLLNLER